MPDTDGVSWKQIAGADRNVKPVCRDLRIISPKVSGENKDE